MESKAATVTVRGVKYDVTLDSLLDLQAVVGGVTVTAKTRDQLIERIGRETRKAAAVYEIPVVARVSNDHYVGDNPNNRGGAWGYRYARVVIRGKNTRTGEALLTLDGKKYAEHNPHIVARGADVSDEQLAELNRLLLAEYAAQRAHGECLTKITKTGTLGHGARLYADRLLEEAAAKAPTE